MVNLTRIYTRTGDAGSTRLADLSEVSKTDPRVQAYGHIDEANSILGLALTAPDVPADISAIISHLQNELFDCGTDLATPLVENPEVAPLRVEEDYLDRLEAWCDQYSAELPELKSFVLPSGGAATAWLHLARTVVRRAERTAWAAAAVHGTQPAEDGRVGGVNPMAVTYLNRLSDLLFILARACTPEGAEVLWVPGKDRQPPDSAAAQSRARITGEDQR